MAELAIMAIIGVASLAAVSLVAWLFICGISTMLDERACRRSGGDVVDVRNEEGTHTLGWRCARGATDQQVEKIK